MRGHQPDRVGADGAHVQGVGGDVLGLDLGEQVEGAAVAGDAFLGAGGGLEQGAQRVQVAVGVAGGRAAAQRGPLQAFAPAAGAVPQLPQPVLAGAAAGQQFADLAQQHAEFVGAPGVGGVQQGEQFGVLQRLADEFLGGADHAGHAVLGERPAFLLAQGAAEPAQVGAVEGGERAGEQGVREVGGERALALGADPQRQQQRGDGGLLAQRQVVAVDLQRHAGGGQRAADARYRPGAGPDQHRHLPPGDAVLQVGAAQQVGDRVEFGAGRRVRVHLDGAALAGGQQGAVGGELVGGQPAHRHPAGEFPGGGEQHGAGAPGHPQHLDLGGPAVGLPEGVGELQDAVHVGAAERVDRLVGVADRDQVPPAAGQPLQQPDLGGVGVLVLVDEHHVVAAAQLGGDLLAFGEQHGAVDEFGVVEDAAQVEHVQVLGEEVRGGGPVGAADALREAQQLLLAEAEFAAAGEHGADLVGEAAGGQAGPQVERPADGGGARLGVLGAAGEQFADHHVLLGAGQQPQRFGVLLGRLVGAQQGVAERVEGGGLRGGGADPGGHPVAQFHRGLAAEGEHQHAFGGGAVGDPPGDRLDQRGGLAGAGPGEHQQRPRRVLDHRPLEVVQHGRVGLREGAAHQAER